MYRILLAIIACMLATAVEAQSWGGAYAGISLGGFQGKSTWTTTELANTPVSPASCPSCNSFDQDLGANSGYFSGHVGYNWALGRAAFVGIEASSGNANAQSTATGTPGLTFPTDDDRIETTYEWNASIVGRIGLTAGRFAFYGIVGPSWQKMSIRYICPATANSFCALPHSENRADVRRGWTAGAGMEWAIQRRWSARLDFRYARYEEKEYKYFSDSPFGIDEVSAKTTLSTSVVTLGASYRF